MGQPLEKRSKNVREQTRNITPQEASQRMLAYIKRLGFKPNPNATRDQFGTGPDQRGLLSTPLAGSPQHELGHALMTPEGRTLREHQKLVGSVTGQQWHENGISPNEEMNAFVMQAGIARRAGVGGGGSGNQDRSAAGFNAHGYHATEEPERYAAAKEASNAPLHAHDEGRLTISPKGMVQAGTSVDSKINARAMKKAELPKWKNRPIVDAKHSDELEIDAALNEFRDRMPRRQAEDTAHRAYLREHHSASAAHHLRGMRAANAAGDDKAAEKHSAMYAMHCRELGHDPYGEPDSSIQKRAEAQEKDEVYKFRAHKADGLLQPVAKGERLDVGAVLAKALPKGDEALAGANGPENQINSGANQVAQDHFMEQGAKLAEVPPKPQHVNAIHGDYWRGHNNRELIIANSGRGYPNDPGPDHPADTQMRQGQLPANQLTGRTEKGVIMPTTGVRTADEIRGEASQANYAQSVAQGLDSRLEFGNFPPSVSREPGHALDPQGGWAGSPGLNPAQSNLTAKTLESAFWSRLANAAKVEAGRFPMPPVAPWTGAGPYKKSEPDFWAVLAKAAELETGHPSRAGVKSAPVTGGPDWQTDQQVFGDAAQQQSGPGIKAASDLSVKLDLARKSRAVLPRRVEDAPGKYQTAHSGVFAARAANTAAKGLDPEIADLNWYHHPVAVTEPRSAPEFGMPSVPVEPATMGDSRKAGMYWPERSGFESSLNRKAPGETYGRAPPAGIYNRGAKDAERLFWQHLNRLVGLAKAIPKGDEGLLGQNGLENQLNRGVHGVMEDHLLEQGAKRKEENPPREEPTVPQFMEGPKASAGQVPLKDLQAPSQHKYPIVGQRSPEDVIHETSTQADQMYDKMNEGVPRSQQLQQFPLTTSYASTAVHNLRGGQPEYHFWKWLGRAAGIGVQPVKPTNGLYDLPIDADSK